MDEYYNEYRASIHRGVYPLAARATDAYEGARDARRRVRRLDARRDGLHAQRDRGDQPRRLLVGPRQRRRGRPRRRHADGAPLQPRPVAAAVRGDRRRAGLRAGHRRRACSTSTRSTALLARAPKLVAVTHVSNVLGTVNPIAEIAERAHAAGARRDGRRRAGRAAPAGRRRRAGRRLLRLDRPQGLRADRHRRPARPPRAAGGDAAVPRRRAHDLPRRRLRVVRGRSRPRASRPARCRWPRRSASAPPSTTSAGSAWRPSGSTRATSSATRSSACSRSPGSRSTARSTLAHRGTVCSFAFEGVHPHDVAEILGREGVCVRAGHHCAQPLMRRLGVARQLARVVRRALHARRRRPAGRRPRARAGGVRLMDDLYREQILEHYKQPQNWGEPDGRPGPRVRGLQPAVRRRAEGPAQASARTSGSPTCASPATAARSRRRRPRWPPTRSSGCRWPSC